MRRAAIVLVLVCGCPHATPPAAPVEPPLPAAAYAHYLRGQLAMDASDFALAAEELRAAAAAAPDEPRIEVERIRALAKDGRKADVRIAIAAAETRWPRSADVWLIAGDVARATDAPAE